MTSVLNISNTPNTTAISLDCKSSFHDPNDLVNDKELRDAVSSLVYILVSLLFSPGSIINKHVFEIWLDRLPPYDGGDNVHDICFIRLFMKILFCEPRFELEKDNNLFIFNEENYSTKVPCGSILLAYLPPEGKTRRTGLENRELAIWMGIRQLCVVDSLVDLLETCFKGIQTNLVNRKQIMTNFSYPIEFANSVERYRFSIVSEFIKFCTFPLIMESENDFVTNDDGVKPRNSTFQATPRNIELAARRKTIIFNILDSIVYDTRVKYPTYFIDLCRTTLGDMMDQSRMQDLPPFPRAAFMGYMTFKNDVEKIIYEEEETAYNFGYENVSYSPAGLTPSCKHNNIGSSVSFDSNSLAVNGNRKRKRE